MHVLPLPWPYLNLGLTLFWPCFYLALTFPSHCLYPDLTLPWSYLDLYFTLPWCYSELALTFPWSFFVLALTLPWFCIDNHALISLPWPCPDIVLTLPRPCLHLFCGRKYLGVGESFFCKPLLLSIFFSFKIFWSVQTFFTQFFGPKLNCSWGQGCAYFAFILLWPCFDLVFWWI